MKMAMHIAAVMAAMIKTSNMPVELKTPAAKGGGKFKKRLNND